MLVEILNRTVWNLDGFHPQMLLHLFKKIYSLVWAMAQNAEGKVMVVNSGKVLERKLKNAGNQSGDGERGETE